MESLEDLSQLQNLKRVAAEMYSLRLYLKIYIAGVLTVFLLGTTLTTIFLFIYLFYEFNIYESIYSQIPNDLRKTYKSKIVLFVKWLDRIVDEAIQDNSLSQK